MLFAGLVIEQDTLLQRVFNNLLSDLAILSGGGGRDFKHVVSGAGVTAGVSGDLLQDFVGCAQVHFAQATLLVFQSTPQQHHDLVFAQLVQDVNAAAREQSTVNLK